MFVTFLLRSYGKALISADFRPFVTEVGFPKIFREIIVI